MGVNPLDGCRRDARSLSPGRNKAEMDRSNGADPIERMQMGNGCAEVLFVGLGGRI